MKKMVILLLLFVLPGCMNADESNQQNRGPADEYIPIVQKAIDDYQKDTGVLPLKNKSELTPIYEKYPIDFNRLLGQYLNSIPDNAFEQGGPFIYVLIHVETKPIVKLMDLTLFQRIADLQRDVDQYISKYHGIPSDKMISPHFYALSFKKLNKKPLQVRSDYSGQICQLIVSDKGVVLIDYAPDIMRFIQKNKMQHIDPTLDLRNLLADEFPFVPVHSQPYYWYHQEPVLSHN